MFVRDCWYVAAWSHKIEAGKIRGVQIMNTALIATDRHHGLDKPC